MVLLYTHPLCHSVTPSPHHFHSLTSSTFCFLSPTPSPHHHHHHLLVFPPVAQREQRDVQRPPPRARLLRHHRSRRRSFQARHTRAPAKPQGGSWNGRHTHIRARVCVYVCICVCVCMCVGPCLCVCLSVFIKRDWTGAADMVAEERKGAREQLDAHTLHTHTRTHTHKQTNTHMDTSLRVLCTQPLADTGNQENPELIWGDEAREKVQRTISDMQRE